MDHMEEEAYQAAAAAGSDARRRRRHLRVPETEMDRRRRRPSPSEPGFDAFPPSPAQLPDLEFEVVWVEAPPPRKRACVPASTEAIQGLLQEVTASGVGGDDECAICLQDLFHVQQQQQEDKQQQLRAMPCSHIFHQHCIFEWLRRKTVCPLCRRQLMMPTTPPRTVSAFHSDDDEDYIASLGDAVIMQEFEEEEDVADMERVRMIVESFTREWANRPRT